MEQFTIGDQTIDADEVRALRENIIVIRDHALKEANFDWAVILSNTVAILAHVADKMEAHANGQG